MESRLHQQLLELHYGLLADEEAAEMRARLTREPELASAWDQVRQEVTLIAQAARFESAPLGLKLDESQAIKPISPAVRHVDPQKTRARSSGQQASWGWAIGLAAGVMLVLSLGGFQFHRTRLARLDRELPRVVIAGPARLTPGVSNRFTVTASTVSGQPLAMNMLSSLYDADRQQNLQLHRQETDRQGRMTIEFTARDTLPVRAELRLATAQGGLQSPLAALSLPVAKSEYRTKVTTDRSSYQPGDEVYFRSVTLRESDLKPMSASPILFELLDAAGNAVVDQELVGLPDRGVGNGAFELPVEAAAGEYRILASSVDDRFTAAEQRFRITPPKSDRLGAEIAFLQPDFAPGEDVSASLRFWHDNGAPAAGAEVTLLARIAEQEVWREVTQLDRDGRAQVHFGLPTELSGDATFTAVANVGSERAIANAKIPVNSDAADVRFYPEGGDLIAGVENRVYFAVRDRLNRALDVSGEIVDDQQHVLSEATTRVAGRGMFRISPQAGRTYRLHLPGADDANAWPTLPMVRSDQAIALSVPQSVIAAGEPVRAVIHDRRGKTPLVVATYCRGRQVGQSALVTVPGQNRIQTDPGGDADGLLRVTVMDCTDARPRPVAERLVYRHPARRLKVDVQGLKEGIYLPEESVRVQAQVSDESDHPAAGVVLGVAVGDAGWAAPAGKPETSIEAYFRLASQLDRTDQMEHADLTLGDSKASTEALELLLGTQGWRRFVDAPAQPLAQQRMAPNGAVDALDAAELLLWDNLADVRPLYEQRSKKLRSEQAHLLAVLMICGGVGLALTLVLATLWRLVASLEWALPSLAAAAGCVTMGVLLVRSTERATPPAATVAFAHSAPLVEVAAAPRIERLAEKDDSMIAEPAKDAAAMPEAWALGKGGLPDDAFEKKTDALEMEDRVLSEFDENAAPPTSIADQPAAVNAPEAAPPPAQEPAEPRAQEELEGLVQQATPAPAAVPALKSADGAQDFSRPEYFEQSQFTPVTRRLIAGRDARRQLQRDGVREEAQSVYRGFSRGGRGAGDPSTATGAAVSGDDKASKSKGAVNAAEALRRNVVAPAQRAAAAQHEQFIVRQYAYEPPLSADPNQASAPASVYWHPFLITDEEGKATFEFHLGSEEAENALRIDAHDTSGRIAAVEKQLQVAYPLSLVQSLPSGLTDGDRYDALVQIENRSGDKQSIAMQAHGDAPALEAAAPAVTIELLPKERKQVYLSYLAEQPAARDVVIGLEGNTSAPNDVTLYERLEQRMTVTPNGYPVVETQAGWLTGSKEIAVVTPTQPISGSLSVRLFAYPGFLADLEHAHQSVAALPRENLNSQFALAQFDRRLGGSPSTDAGVAGVTLSQEPTAVALALGFNNEANLHNFWSFGENLASDRNTTLRRGAVAFGAPFGAQMYHDSDAILQRGYSRDATTSGSQSRARYAGGERAGRARGGVGGANDNLGFGYAGLAKAPADVTLAWSIANGNLAPEASESKLRLKQADEYARQREEPLTVGVVANGLLQLGEQDAAHELLERLETWQEADGSVPNPGAEAGKPVALESTSTVANTSIAALAWFKSPAHHEAAKKAVEWLGTQRASGGFGSADDTYLALRALESHAESGYRGAAEGEFKLTLGETVVASQTLDAARPGLVTFDSLESQLRPGENRLLMSATTPAPIPYGVEVRYYQSTPPNTESQLLELSTALATESLPLDQQTRLSVEVSNRSAVERQFVTAEIGLPAGLEPVKSQLDGLRSRSLIDFYETRSRTIIPYWIRLAPLETRRVELDVKATAPGQFTGPASSVYLLNVPNAKTWSAPLKVEVTQPAQ